MEEEALHAHSEGEAEALHCGVEVTQLSTNEQQYLSNLKLVRRFSSASAETVKEMCCLTMSSVIFLNTGPNYRFLKLIRSFRKPQRGFLKLPGSLCKLPEASGSCLVRMLFNRFFFFRPVTKSLPGAYALQPEKNTIQLATFVGH